MKHELYRVNSFHKLKELYGKSDLSKAVKPGHDPKGIKPKETPKTQPRLDDNE